MKTKSLLIVSLIVILLLSACGSAPTPTMSANDIANTAVANAWISVTLTQAALPTATATLTPLPPTVTWTPMPTMTFVPTSVPATATLSAAQDPCNQPPPSEPKGTVVQVKFINKSNGSVNLSFGMVQANDLGECGTYGFSIGRFDAPVVSVLAGCYWAYGWVTGDTPSTAQSTNYLCVPDKSQVWEIQIGTEVVELKQ